MEYRVVLADAIALFHLLYVAAIVIGQLLIVAGACLKWQWVRNPFFRWGHVTMIVVVAAEAICGVTCPLTVWERGLRRAASAPVYDGTFVSQLVNRFIVHPWPEWVFSTLHISFAVLVLATMWLAPPRRFGRTSAQL